MMCENTKTRFIGAMSAHLSQAHGVDAGPVALRLVVRAALLGDSKTTATWRCIAETLQNKPTALAA